MKVLITGATGFIGKALVSSCIEKGYSVVAATRRNNPKLPASVSLAMIASLESYIDWAPALKNVTTVIHLAGRAHTASDYGQCRSINFDATVRLAKQASANGVRRFIFLSSIGVNGNINNTPFTESDTPMPVEGYAISKYEAEKALLKIGAETNMEVVIIRPPLVYGANAPGNFGLLLKWANKNIPLPLGAVHNRRSLVALDNLVSFIICCINHPRAANEIFLISDGVDISTTQLLKKIKSVLGKPAWLIPVPVMLMIAMTVLLGKGGMARRLFGNLQVDSSKARESLGWSPVVTMDEQLKELERHK